MSYYTGVGDYYSGKGDPGLFSSIGKIMGSVGSILPGPFGAAAKIGSRLLGAGSQPKARTQPTRPTLQVPSPVPGIRGVTQRFIPGGASGYQCPSGSTRGDCESGYHLDKTTRSKCVRNRKVNYTNPRALSRASKRLDGFVTVARRALKSTGYKVVSKSYKQNWRKPLKK